jgi:hypothetical protein
MMSSRSIIWTLTNPNVPRPSPKIRKKMARKMRRLSRKRSAKPYRRSLESVASHKKMFTDPPTLRLMPSAPKDHPDSFLAALAKLDAKAAHRPRKGRRRPVRQEVTPQFVEAALGQWLSAGDKKRRAKALRKSGVLDRLVRKGLLTEETWDQLRDPAGSLPTSAIPRDFCDDGKSGLDLGLSPGLRNVRKVCYGIFRDKFPASAVDATDPALWHERCPQFWLRSEVVAKVAWKDSKCRYQAGLLREEVNLPNRLQAFGPVLLTFERTTARDRSWSYVTYKLADQNMVKVDEGWYLVQRRPGSAHAAIMVKAIEFYGNNDWLDSVCETGLLDGGRELLGIDQGVDQGRPSSSGRSRAGSDGVLTNVVTNYLDECRAQWDDLGAENLDEMSRGLAQFESQPLRFNWIDNMFGVIEQSTSFMSTAASKWADVVQQDLPEALARADAHPQSKRSKAGQSTTSAHVVGAAWRTALGAYQVGSDISRAMLQVLGPGIGKSDTAIVEGLSVIQRSGDLTKFLEQHDVTDVAAARKDLFDSAPHMKSETDLANLLHKVTKTHGKKQSKPVDRTAFAQKVWDAGQSVRRRTAGS